MKNRERNMLRLSAGLLTAFALWTAAVATVDTAPIGPLEATVGFATLNGWVHRLTGVHWWLYHLTDWLSLVPIGIAAAFALLGLGQWIRRKDLRRVDRSLLLLGGFYLTVIAVYALFEGVVINRRPVLIDGELEASYPSSTTVLVLCVMPTAAMQLRRYVRSRALGQGFAGFMTAFALLMAIGRLLCGVHWFTDVVGGALLSAGLVLAYRAFLGPSGKS